MGEAKAHGFAPESVRRLVDLPLLVGVVCFLLWELLSRIEMINFCHNLEERRCIMAAGPNYDDAVCVCADVTGHVLPRPRTAVGEALPRLLSFSSRIAYWSVCLDLAGSALPDLARVPAVAQ